MANATRTTRKVEKVVEVEEPDGVVLELTQEEADTLFAVLGRVGGAPSTRRGLSDHIFDALYEAGFRSKDSLSGLSGTLYFVG